MRNLLVVALLATGCGGDDPAVVDAGPTAHDSGHPACSSGVPASLDDCFTGEWFADCGGMEPALFACNPATYDCRWFTGICLPEGYVASTCTAGDICCHDDWPFTPDQNLGDGDVSTYLGFYAWGTEPWNHAREMNLAVVVDAALGTPPLSITCTGAPPSVSGASPCDADTGDDWSYRRDVDTIYFVIGAGDLFGWTIGIEIDTAFTTPVARACVLPYTDAIPIECPDRAAYCASSGTVTVSTLDPGSLGLSLDATFPDGFTVQATASAL